MTSLTTSRRKLEEWPALWRRLMRTNRFLALTAVVSLVLFGLTLILSIVDTRLVTGAPAWFKPMKFAISIALYTGTLAWMLSFVEGRRRWVNLIGSMTVLGFVVELVIIFFQAARGVRSHFNAATAFDSALFSIMGLFVIVIWVMNLAAAVLLLRQPLPDRAFAWSLRLGLLVTAVGAALAFAMTSPTPEQVAVMEGGEMPSLIGAHSVGVVDGGEGLPFTGWSTEGGDLRVPHFVGLHALQIIPLLGILINRRWQDRLSEARRTALVWSVGLGYMGLVLLLLWQALRGQPLVAPDAATLAAAAGLVVAVLVSGTAVFTFKRG